MIGLALLLTAIILFYLTVNIGGLILLCKVIKEEFYIGILYIFISLLILDGLLLFVLGI